MPPVNGLLLPPPYSATLDTANHVEPAVVNEYDVVDPETVLALSYPDMPASLVLLTATDPVHVTTSFRDGDDVKLVGYVMLAV